MRQHILYELTIAILALPVGVISLLFAMTPSFADVEFKELETTLWITITKTISKTDANLIAQHARDFEYGDVHVWLNSLGGDVDAAMQIGRLIRTNDVEVSVARYSKCYSACALLYIAGVSRKSFGVVGLHRPYFASTPQSRQTIERQAPLMLQQLKSYVQEMGITDSFYQEMVNAEPSNIKLYNGDSIRKLVPSNDPTYDEVRIADDSRSYGVINTSEMRKRFVQHDRCGAELIAVTGNMFADISPNKCDALLWGLSEHIYEERFQVAQKNCRLSDDENNLLKSLKRNERPNHPISLKRSACMINTMFGR